MTAIEAFSEAFDNIDFSVKAEDSSSTISDAVSASDQVYEAEALDEEKSPVKKTISMKNPAALEGASNTIGPMKSLSEHKAEGCDAEKNGHPERCPYVQRMAKDLEKSKGLSRKDALAGAIKAHNGAASIASQKAGDSDKARQAVAQVAGNEKPQQPSQKPQDTNVQAAEIDGLVKNPESIETHESKPLANGEEVVETAEGKVSVSTDTQKAVVEVLSNAVQEGGDVGKDAEKAISKLQNTSTEHGDSESDESASVETVAQPSQKKTYTTKHLNPGASVELDDEAAEILEKQPEKAGIIERMIDADIKLKNAKSEYEKELNKSAIQSLNTLFYGGYRREWLGGLGKESQENAVEEPAPAKEPVEEVAPVENNSENVGEKKEEQATQQQTATETPKDASKDTAKSKPQSTAKVHVQEPYSRNVEPPPPRDSLFETGKKNVYEVNDKEYVDVSKMGLLHGLIASFLAGMRGQEVITSWDRVSGKWDNIKRSEPGNNLRSGITASLLSNEIAKSMNNRSLDGDARTELSIIQDMAREAKTPAQQLAAFKKFAQWKKDNGFSKENNKTGSSKEEEHFSEALVKGMDAMHAGGKCVTGSKSIDKDGREVSDEVPNDKKVPGADILGKPEFENKASIKDVEAKKKKVKDFIEGKTGIPLDDIQHVTSFNQTFFSIPVKNRTMGKAIESMVDDIKGELGSNDVKASFDPKSKTVIVSVDNDVKGDVAAKEMFQSKEWEEAKKKMKVPLVIGKDMDGKPVIVDLKKLVHLLVGGMTGQGKSYSMNTILTSIMMGRHPKNVKFVLIDPKGVEFSAYNDSEHNLLPVAQSVADSIHHLKWVKAEMENRQKLLNETNSKYHLNLKNIDDYNDWARENGKEEMPVIVTVIDELTELMKEGGDELNALTGTLGNLARFTGIHVIAGTQHPTKKNIGDMKDNFPSRLGFATLGIEGSQAILGHGDRVNKVTGEKELGTTSLGRAGEFIFETNGKQIHGQGAALGKGDIERVNAYWGGGSGNSAGGEISAASGGKETAAPASLPKEYTDAIEEAVKNKRNVSLQEIDGMEEAFRKSLPEGWKIEREEVDGESYLKATPPAPSRVVVPSSEETEESDDVDGAQANTKTPEDKKQDESPNTEKSADETEDFDMDSRQGMIEHAKKERDKAIAKAKEDFKKHKDLKKFNDKLNEIEDKHKEWVGTADRLFPETEDGDLEPAEHESSEHAGEKPAAENKEEDRYESPRDRANKPEVRINSARERYESAAKALEKRIGAKKDGITHRQYIEELDKLDADYRDYESQVRAGKSDREIYEARDKAKKDKESERAADYEKKRSLVTTEKNGKKVAGASHILDSSRGNPENIVPMPKRIADIAKKNLPEGFEIDSDDNGTPLTIKGRYGFARHPNGSYGRIDSDGKFHLWVDTTSPSIVGEKAPETIEAKKKWLDAEPGSNEEKELKKTYNQLAFGVDVQDEWTGGEGNVAMVAMAVAKALALNDTEVEG